MCYWCGRNLYPARKQCRKQNNWNNDLFKVSSQCIGTCKQNDTNGVCWWHWADHYVGETYAMFSKYYLAQIYMRCKLTWWSCKLTYPVIYRLTLSKSDLHQRSTILHIYKPWTSILTIRRTTIAQVSATQTECIWKLNYQTQPKTNKWKCKAK